VPEIAVAGQFMAQRQTNKDNPRRGTGAARHGTGAARHGTARHGTARHGTARHGTARHGTVESTDLPAF